MFFKSSLALLASHRFNLLMSAVANVVWTGGQLITLQFLFEKVESFNGWSINDMILLLGFGQFFVYTMFVVYYNNHIDLQAKIVDGTLDNVLTKPVNAKFFTSFEKVSIAQLFPFLVAVIPLIAIGARDLRALTAGDVMISLLILILGIFIMFFLSLALTSLNFYTDNANGIRDMVTNTTDLGRIPLNYFPSPIQLVFTFAIPLAFVTYYPVLVLKSPQNISLILGVEWLLLVAFVVISHLLWSRGIRRYSGAS